MNVGQRNGVEIKGNAYSMLCGKHGAMDELLADRVDSRSIPFFRILTV